MQQNIADIMQQLLKLANEVDVDALSNVMEEFVEVFASELTPFAVQLTEQLVCSRYVCPLGAMPNNSLERHLSPDSPGCY